jgi:hypothetical protein
MYYHTFTYATGTLSTWQIAAATLSVCTTTASHTHRARMYLQLIVGDARDVCGRRLALYAAIAPHSCRVSFHSQATSESRV